MKISERIVRGWNAFMNKDPTPNLFRDPVIYESTSTSGNPGLLRPSRARDQSMVDAIISRIALDAAKLDIYHCYVDEDNRYIDKVDSSLNECLSVWPNLDQSPQLFKQDMYLSMMDWGTMAVVPVETEDVNPNDWSGRSVNPTQLRVGKITQWAADRVKLNVYNEDKGKRQDIWMKKEACTIVENPFYDTMNRPNSAIQRLKAKLNLSDIIDNRSKSNKFDMIIQMPYTIKTEGKEKLAEKRIKRLEEQLSNSNYGIGYIDATEKVTQLNRSLDNNIQTSIEYYLNLIYTEFGITPEVMNGTADDKVMNNYYTRTVEPIVNAVCEEMRRKFLSKTARSQGQSIKYYRDPFAFVATSELPDLVDKFTRNEIATTNEMRQAIGMRPSLDPQADILRNKNISMPGDMPQYDVDGNIINQQNQQVPPDNVPPQ